MNVTGLLAPAFITGVEFDAAALRLIAACAGRSFLEVSAGDVPRPGALRLHVTPTSSPGPVVLVSGETEQALRVHYSPQPYAISAVLLALRDVTGDRIRCTFPWPAGLPRALAAVLGWGSTAAEVRALLWRAEPDRSRRPVVQMSE